MNKYVPHVYVIPEDDRDRQIADGFVLHNNVDARRIQVMPIAGGWNAVLQTFKNEYIRNLKNRPEAHVVMLIDFDGKIEDRRAQFQKEIPDDIKSRVFVVGSSHNPEKLKQSLREKSFEDIGLRLATECYDGSALNWNHEQLQHNREERQRLLEHVRPFLFVQL